MAKDVSAMLYVYVQDDIHTHTHNVHAVYTGSEFWRTQEKIGDDVTGIRWDIWYRDTYVIIPLARRATLTQTERGNPPDLEHITTSDMIKTEMSEYQITWLYDIW